MPTAARGRAGHLVAWRSLEQSDVQPGEDLGALAASGRGAYGGLEHARERVLADLGGRLVQLPPNHVHQVLDEVTLRQQDITLDGAAVRC